MTVFEKKVCARCKLQYPKTTEYFAKRYGRNTEDVLSYCKKCFISIQSKRHADTKTRLLEYKGKKCIICGYCEHEWNLTFHHLDPSKKEIMIAKTNRSFEALRPEVDKCIVVCHNCHGDIHHGLYPEHLVIE